MIDTHTHLNFKVFNKDLRNIIERAVAAGVKKMIVVGTDIESSLRAIELADKYEELYASVGIHPHHVKGFLGSASELESATDKIKELSKHSKVVAIGETGLDFHQYIRSKYRKYNSKNNSGKICVLQEKIFFRQIKLALEMDKPMIIHSREAKDKVLTFILKKSKMYGKNPRGVFHCYEGGKSYLRKILAAGFYVSFTGNITYAQERAKVASLVPLERLLLESDCPFMSPFPRRGQRNEPANVKIIAEKHAELRGVHITEVAKSTSKATYNLFNL